MTAYGTLIVFCVYLFVIGIGGMLAPDMLADLVGMPHASDVWGRVAAMLVFNLGILYIWIIRTRSAAMISYTVFTRMVVLVVLTSFFLAKLAPVNIVIFGALDALGGLWTLWALKRDRRMGRLSVPPQLS